MHSGNIQCVVRPELTHETLHHYFSFSFLKFPSSVFRVSVTRDDSSETHKPDKIV